MKRGILAGAGLVFLGASLAYNIKVNIYLCVLTTLLAGLGLLIGKRNLSYFYILSFCLSFSLMTYMEGQPREGLEDSQIIHTKLLILEERKSYDEIRTYLAQFPSGERTILQVKGKEYQPANLIKGRFKIETIRSQGNPRLFDYQAYMKSRGVYGKAIELDGQILGNGGSKLFRLKTRVLAYLDRELVRGLDEDNYQLMRQVLTARSDLSEENQESFRQLGLAHLMAISGLHLSILAGLLLAIFQSLGIHRNVSYLALSFLLLFYLYLTDYPVSALRAFGMLAIAMGANLLREGYSTKKALGVSVYIIVLTNPYRVLDLGLVLSALSILGIIYLAKDYKLEKLGSYSLSSALKMSLAVNLVLFPFLIYYYNSFNLLTFLANLIVVPVFVLAIQLAFFKVLLGIVFPGPSLFLGRMVNVLLNIIGDINSGLARIEFFSIRLPSPDFGLTILYFGLVFILLRRYYFRAWSFKLRLAMIKIFTFIILGQALAIQILDPMEVTFIDIGQGDSTYVRYRQLSFLIDTGGHYLGSASYDYTLKPFLVKNTWGRLDMVFLSHDDLDHMGNFQRLVEDGLASRAIANFPLDGGQAILEGQGLVLGRLKVRVIEDGSKGIDSNDSSLVMVLDHYGNRVIFTGDMTAQAEARSIDKDIRAQVLKVSHHGSSSSTGEDFIGRVGPKEAVISVGKNNYGHPASEVLERLANRGVQVYRTDQRGAIRMFSSRFGYSIFGQKDQLMASQLLPIILAMAGLAILIYQAMKGSLKEDDIKLY